MPHNLHVHTDRCFQILEYADETPPSALRGLKDTVLLPPGATVCPATRFSDHTDPAVAHTFHCHLRQHEDRG